jgi:hypothetical protein
MFMKKFVTVCSLAAVAIALFIGLAIALFIGLAIAAEGPGPDRGGKGHPQMMQQFNPVERVVRSVERITEKPLTDDQKKAIGDTAKVQAEAMKAARGRRG